MSWLYPFAPSTTSSHSHSHRRHRSKDRRSHHHHHHSNGSSYYGARSSAPSLFSLGSHANRSSRSMASSIFSTGSSSRRAKPRSGFISRMVRKIKRLFRKMVRYAQHHPFKVFLLVIVPLITGGVLQKLLGMVGIRMPRALSGLLGNGAGGMTGGGGGGDGYYRDGGSGGSGAGEGLKESVNGLVSLAKMFL